MKCKYCGETSPCRLIIFSKDLFKCDSCGRIQTCTDADESRTLNLIKLMNRHEELLKRKEV